MQCSCPRYSRMLLLCSSSLTWREFIWLTHFLICTRLLLYYISKSGTFNNELSLATLNVLFLNKKTKSEQLQLSKSFAIKNTAKNSSVRTYVFIFLPILPELFNPPTGRAKLCLNAFCRKTWSSRVHWFNVSLFLPVPIWAWSVNFL